MKIFWTKERCHEEALKYKYKKDFDKYSHWAYTTSRNNKWLDDICSHMIPLKKPTGFWNNKENCRIEALKYDNHKEFNKYSNVCYEHCLKNKWVEELTSHFIRKFKPKNYWSFDKCKEEALKYETKSNFYNNSKGAYLKALKNNWLNDICVHMQILGSLYKRLIYVYEFSDNYAYIGLTYNPELRNIHHNYNLKSPIFKHIKQCKEEPILKFLTSYIDVEKAVELEEYYLNFYKNNGWNILNKAKTGAIGNGKKIKWSFENCKLEALKYNTRTEFHKNSYGAYDASYKKGWLNDVCNHMITNKKPNGYWTKDKCQEEALKYSTRFDFYNNSPSAYDKCLDNKWLNEVCFHMKGKVYTKWTKELCYQEYLKYNSKRDFRVFSRNAYASCLTNKWLDDIYNNNI